MSVSPNTENALREAMTRLLTGKPKHTNGTLTKQNLHKEAQVSRATMNRATQIIAEWNAHLAEHGPRTPGESRRDTELTQLRRKLTNKTDKCSELQHQLDAAATVIAALHHDNAALRDELDRHQSTVMPLRHRSHQKDHHDDRLPPRHPNR